MDYRAAYQNLVELFPQVDSRILRAVAIEHSTDVHAAVEFILYEVLSSFSGPFDSAQNDQVMSNEVQIRGSVNNQGVEVDQQKSVACGPTLSGDFSDSKSHLGGVVEENVIDLENEDHCSPLTRPKSLVSGIAEDGIIDLENEDQYSSLTRSKSLKSDKAEENIIYLENEDHCSSLTSSEECPGLIGYESLVKDISRSVSECEEQLSRCSDEDIGKISVSLESSHDILLPVSYKSRDLSEYGAEVPKAITASFCETEGNSWCLAENHPVQLACGFEMVSLEKDDPPVIQSTRSGHVVNVDFLEDCVTDAKSIKKTLVSAVESVVSMMKEAELLEERAKKTKEEASVAGEEILTKVDELKHMLQRAKQTNDMHAGEVYGEKAILSTEARELQSRLLNLSDERNKSFMIVEEIRQTLETRLAAARNEIEAAEHEKLEKEELAQKALKEQEAFMDAIVQESIKLQQEAEENSKLREFLVDRGRVVDTLQGEIAVICEDVILLKKRVDERAPLKGSLLMTTYSTVYSSSSSGHRSIHSAAELDENTTGSSDNYLRSQEQDKFITSEKAVASDRQKLSSDDDWELLRQDGCPF